MTTVLDRIVEETRQGLGVLRADRRELEQQAHVRSETKKKHRFASAIRPTAGSNECRIIAEVKAASPSAGPIVEQPDVEAIASDYQRGGAAAISVVTEPRHFRGSLEWLSRAAEASGLPVLMKDFVIDPVQIHAGVAAGADAVLLLGSLLEPARIAEMIALLDELGCDALVEAHDEAELERAMEGGARIIGINSRDLKDFRVDLAVAERLGPRIPDDAVKVAESGIRSRQDVERLQEAGFHAMLVGESLLRSGDREGALRALLGTPHVG